FSNTSYILLTDKCELEKVPTNLKNLWNNDDKLSFKTLTISHNSDIDKMLISELIRQIFNELCLIIRLKIAFSKTIN
ncbi:hypothetical protein QP440_09255, partial [Aerococcus urinae]|uniref:hypothetical protein n=1 Tax=Aerococcus urinae TaxID=1376 RepID=UPI00254B7EC6